MALTPIAIADGQLPAAKGTLYTVPASTIVVLTSFTLVGGATARTVNIYVNRTGTSRRIIAKDTPLDINGSMQATGRTEVLEAGDLIEGDASAATEIDYVFSGYKST